MYHVKDDYRAIRSTKMIYEGLVQLIPQKEFATITVTDLVNAAKVGRTTFYRNFDTIEDVLKLRCDQIADGLIVYLVKFRQSEDRASQTALLKPILRYFQMNSEIIELLIKAERMHIFEEAILKRFEPFKPYFGQFFQIEEEYVDYIMAIRVGSVSKVLTHWVSTGKKQNPDELANKLGVLVNNTIALEKLF